MIFTDVDDQTLELKITNYEFPDNLDGGRDSNRLNIDFNVKSHLGNWYASDPSITTMEVQELVDWFEKLSKNEKSIPNLFLQSQIYLLNYLKIAKEAKTVRNQA